MQRSNQLSYQGQRPLYYQNAVYYKSKSVIFSRMPAARSSLIAIIDEAIKREAADIIISFGCYPVVKANDKLVPLEQFGALSDNDVKNILVEILPPNKASILDKERQVDLAYVQGDARFRVNAFYQRGHVSIVMRYIRSHIRSVEELGLPELVKDLVGNDNGLILMVGPTGSGKSTSLAAMIDHINANAAKHIVTIEDPVEYIYQNKVSLIEQREIGQDVTSFAAGLRSALREAPDVVLVGEMRDLESIAAAITVAETGHLVLSTIHANTAPGTIDRIIDIFPEGNKSQIRVQLADILIAVLNQRLVPLADGSGSKAFIEVMVNNSAVANSIRTGNTTQLPTVIQTSLGDGMVLLDDLLIKSTRRGEITKETALAFANNREEVKKQLALA
jgi:twitching motility protein PilT